MEGVGETAAEEEARVWSWGAGSDGQLGIGTLDDRHVPQPLPSTVTAQRISRIACGGAHAIALTEEGMVMSWGRGTRGQLGHGELGNCSNPKLVKFFESITVSHVSAGWNHSGFVTENGHLFMCGDGSFGQLGNGDHQSHVSPVEAPLFVSRHVEQVACGMRHSLVLVRGPSGDSVYGFGSGRHGQVGLSGSGRSNNLPIIIDGLENCKILQICANGDHSAALSDSGQLYTWGKGFKRRGIDSYCPQILPSSLRFSQVALGWNHALLLAEGEVYILGGNQHGMLSGPQQDSMDPKEYFPSVPCSTSSEVPEASGVLNLERIPSLVGEKVMCIAAGAEHSALVTEKGSIMTWGWGEHGQLGLGDMDNQTCPRTINIGGLSSEAYRTRFWVYCGSGFTFAVESA